MKAHCLPDNAPDSAFLAAYSYVWKRDPRWLFGLKVRKSKPGDVPMRGLTPARKQARKAA